MRLRTIEIEPFKNIYQDEIDKMMVEILSEFSEPIFTPTSKKIKDLAAIPNNKFWVALFENKVIGTIGFRQLENNSIELKSMFLDLKFRGQGVSKLLLDTLINWAIENNTQAIYLGTMEQFKAAQKFYEKHSFEKISVENLPPDFPLNPFDSIFYKKEL